MSQQFREDSVLYYTAGSLLVLPGLHATHLPTIAAAGIPMWPSIPNLQLHQMMSHLCHPPLGTNYVGDMQQQLS